MHVQIIKTGYPNINVKCIEDGIINFDDNRNVSQKKQIGDWALAWRNNNSTQYNKCINRLTDFNATFSKTNILHSMKEDIKTYC